MRVEGHPRQDRRADTGVAGDVEIGAGQRHDLVLRREHPRQRPAELPARCRRPWRCAAAARSATRPTGRARQSRAPPARRAGRKGSPLAVRLRAGRALRRCVERLRDVGALPQCLQLRCDLVGGALVVPAYATADEKRLDDQDEERENASPSWSSPANPDPTTPSKDGLPELLTSTSLAIHAVGRARTRRPTRQEGARIGDMEALLPWLTPALIIALAAWLRSDLRDMRQEIRDLRRDFTTLGERVASLAERVAHLEGALLRPSSPASDAD